MCRNNRHSGQDMLNKREVERETSSGNRCLAPSALSRITDGPFILETDVLHWTDLFSGMTTSLDRPILWYDELLWTDLFSGMTYFTGQTYSLV